MEQRIIQHLNEAMEQLSRELHSNGENIAESAEYIISMMKNLNETTAIAYMEQVLMNARQQYIQIKIAYKQGTLSKDDAKEMLEMAQQNLYVYAPKFLHEIYRKPLTVLDNQFNTTIAELENEENLTI